MTFKKGQKPPKKGQKLSKVEVKEEVTVQDSSAGHAERGEPQNDDVMGKDITESQVKGKILGTVGGTAVTKPKGTISFEAQQASVPMFMIPADIRQYLINKGFGTNVWRRDKEWLEKHGADMKMIEKLKKFLTTS